MDNLKVEKMKQVAQKTLFLCERNGLDAVTISRVSQLSKVSRPWIYKYIGGTKDKLLAFAFDHFGNEFAMLDSRPSPKNSPEWLTTINAGFDHLLEIGKKNPWALPLYFRYKGHEGIIGSKVRDIEAKFIDKSATEMQKSLGLSKSAAQKQARLLNSIRLALAHDALTAPTSPEKQKAAKEFFYKICQQL